MATSDGVTISCWNRSVRMPRFRPLRGKCEMDVCIVGAGIAGLTTAYFLAKEGKSIVVLDQGPVGGGQTGRTSAHLASAIDNRFVEIERLHGRKAARLAYQSHASAIDAIETICREEKFDCEFARLDAYLSLGPDSPPGLLKREFDAAKRAGFRDIELLQAGGLHDQPSIRFGRQARFHPLRYLAALARVLTRRGVKIYTGRKVRDVQGADPGKHVPATAQLEGGAKVTAGYIVVATNTPAPINDWFGIYTKQSAYRSYVIGMESPHGAVKDALFWDTGNPYHYVRLEPATRRGRRGSDILLIGGEDHKTGQPPARATPFENLEKWAREMFPKSGKVVYRWSGQVQEPEDDLAFIGRALTKKQNVFVVTGDSGMGLTHGTIGGLLITDLIMGRKNPWERLYDPARKVLTQEFVRENINTLSQYKDLVTTGDVTSVRQIARGEGALVRSGLKKLAVFRDGAGKIHRHSALCTHLQCVVQWNSSEKTWDCPCHGSRFSPTGEVIIGPAVDNLPSVR